MSTIKTLMNSQMYRCKHSVEWHLASVTVKHVRANVNLELSSSRRFEVAFGITLRN